MKVLFSNPPGWQNSNGILRKWIRAGSRWPHTNPAISMPDDWRFGAYTPYPFFLGYAASYCARHSTAKVIFRDSVALHESYEVFFEWITQEKPSMVFIESATPSWEHDQAMIRRIHEFTNAQIAVCGPITSIKAQEILGTLPVIACLKGEYEKNALKVINGARGIIEHDLLMVEEMNAAPFSWFDEQHAHRYFDACPVGVIPPHAHVWASRGCFHKCLAGDTPVNTVLGMIPIKELAEKYREIGVFTRDPVENRAKVCTARNIRKTQTAVSLVRVNFDDGSHIDCTPDHRFIAFKWGNQFTGEKEWIIEAKDLKPGQHLRAIKTYDSGAYAEMCWSRYGHEKQHRMIAEWKVGRPILENEQVHHIDGNKLNNHPDNLRLMADAKTHFSEHPEIAERMRKNNPTKNGMGPEWRARLSVANRGKVRTSESRERYRLAAIKREGLKRLQKMAPINHRVVNVEQLPGLHDTYCLEVPETGWFYANNVLVKNCLFCIWPATMTGNDPDGLHKRTVRFYSPAYMEDFLRDIIGRFHFRSIYFDDDTFNLNDRHTSEMCGVMRKIGLPWSAMCRADTTSREVWKEMRDSGCYGVKIGFESGNQHVVNAIIGKKLDLQAAKETRFYLRDIGLKVHGTFTFGLPGETDDQRAETHRFIEELQLDSHQESGTALIEGTPLATLEHDKQLKAYPGAVWDGSFINEADGVKKMALV